MPQTLLIRYSDEENVLRSIGAAPNGILSVLVGEGTMSWCIDAKLVTGRGAPGVQLDQRTPEEAARSSVEMSIADVVSACESPNELFRLAAMLIAAVQGIIGTHAPERDWPTIRAAVDLLEDTLMAVETSLHERGIRDDGS